MTLAALTAREASIFACLCDTVAAPEPLLPAVRDTDAVSAFDSWLARSPSRNRVGLRALLYAAELAPYALGFRARLRTLTVAERARLLDAVESARSFRVRQLVGLMKGMALLSYYGDDGIMRRLGYDPEERLRTGRELRTREGRP